MASEPGRALVLQNSQALTTTPVVTAAVEVEGWGNVALEILTGTMVGNLEIVVELANDADLFFAEPVEDTAAGTTVGNDFLVPVKRYKRTFASAQLPLSVPIICAGYRYLRLSVTAGTSGNAMIFINKLRLASQ